MNFLAKIVEFVHIVDFFSAFYAKIANFYYEYIADEKIYGWIFEGIDYQCSCEKKRLPNQTTLPFSTSCRSNVPLTGCSPAEPVSVSI